MGPMATGRYHSLDALRGAMMLLGIYLHATVAYSRYGSWPWKDGSTTGLFVVSLGLIHVFRMPVFYCIAGFFGALLLEQRGAVGFLRNRAVRILLPFAVGWAVLFPLVAALATTAMNLALEITADRILRYVVYRQEQKAANATINRELAALRRMFILGERSEKVVKRPHIALLQEHNARKGFLEPEVFRAVVAALPEDLKPLVEAAYLTGWRLRSELLTRQWKHVDFKAGWLRLEPGETKNGEGRQVPLIPALRSVLEAQKNKADTLARETGEIIPWLFFRRNGEPIKDLYGAWDRACRTAGVAGLVPHDLRRSAVRNLERASVPRATAMKLVGHKTEAIYRRYAIVVESDLLAGGEKLDGLHQIQGLAKPTVVPFPKSH